MDEQVAKYNKSELTYFEEYVKIQLEFKELADNDASSAFELKTRAASLIETAQETLAEWNEASALSKLNAKATAARRSKELSDKSVSDGKRMMECDEIYLESERLAIKHNYVCEVIEAHISFLEKVYFDCKNIWESVNRRASKN